MRASIPANTHLYHGRTVNVPPTRDWIAFDPEHSGMFASGPNGTLFTFLTTRDLRLVYFDGSSGNKFGGAVDTQDVLFFGEVEFDPHDDWYGELGRFVKMCESAERYGIDGVVRMQYTFEILLCDIPTSGLELVHVAPSVANDGIPAANPDDRTTLSSRTHPDSALAHMLPQPTGQVPIPRMPMVPPVGWKGSLPSTFGEGAHIGSWHNHGEARVRVDPSTMVSFFDPALASLVAARRGLERKAFRLKGISSADVVRVQGDVAEMMARTRDGGQGSGVDWQGVARVVQERYGDRLPYMQYLLHQPYSNASAQAAAAAAVRRALMVSLLPYMRRDHIDTPQWYAQMAVDCATRHVAHLPVNRFTKQEHLLYNATREVLHEICRVHAMAWRDLFDVEEQDANVAERVLAKWKPEFDALIEWLDWPAWMKCEPACRPDEFCRWPQGAIWEHSDPNPDPHCASMSIEDL
ncbi:hypothetical protein FOMPIDRAFT_1047052 [Fomitopsis schrenkii]|uniref:Uncharacterized protein n=1 Tax=Fomitopsis schrenkii TaxID=2126942 RepID=S8FZA5_FOMSC|nr:hypothetical protein FOMPIDRAFT_1047052 [Fomitopsis schrenkii]